MTISGRAAVLVFTALVTIGCDQATKAAMTAGYSFWRDGTQ
jgi:hypothetical protein